MGRGDNFEGLPYILNELEPIFCHDVLYLHTWLVNFPLTPIGLLCGLFIYTGLYNFYCNFMVVAS